MKKRITQTLMALVAFMLLGTAGSWAAALPLPMSDPSTFGSSIYEWTAPSDGLLVFTFSKKPSNSLPEFVGTYYKGSGSLIDDYIKPTSVDGLVYTWEVAGGITYYFEGTTNGYEAPRGPLEITSIEFKPSAVNYPLSLSIATGTTNSNWNATSQVSLANQGKGLYKGVFTVPANSYFKFYGNSDGKTTWYGPNVETSVSFNGGTFSGNVSAEGNAWKISGETLIGATVNLADGTVSFSALEIPECKFLLPSMQGQTIMYGASFYWGDWEYLVSANLNNKIKVQVPGFDTPFSYSCLINSNVKGEINGQDGSGPSYPNSLLVKDFMYNQGGVSGYWRKKGNYVFTIPAGTVYLVIDGYNVPNPETTMTYYCPGTGGYLDMETARLLEPENDEQILTFPTVGGLVGDKEVYFPGITAKFTTMPDPEGWAFQLKSSDPNGVPVVVKYTPKEGTDYTAETKTIYGVICTDKYNPNYVYVDMTSFANPAGSEFPYPLGTYEFTFAEGVVYQDAPPYMDDAVNEAVTYTVYVVDEIILPQAVIEFSGSYKAVTLYNNIGISMGHPQSDVFNYTLDFKSDYEQYVTLQVPTPAFNMTWTAPEGLVSGTDYRIEDGYEENEDEVEVYSLTINFLTEACDGAVFKVDVVGEYAVSDILPEVTPEPGVVTDLSEISLDWNGLTPVIDGETSDITVLINGKTAPGNEVYNAYVQGSTLWLSISTYFDAASATVQVIIPEGFVILSDGTINASEQLSYTLVNLDDNYVVTPAKGSQVFSLDTVELEWDGFEMSLNPDCDENVTFGEYNWLEGGITEPVVVTDVTVNDEGVLVISLDQEYTANGMVAFRIPEGFLNLSVGSMTLSNPSAIYLSYTVASYITVPGNYETLMGELASFAVIAQNSIEFTGDLEDVTVEGYGDPLDVTVAEVKNTEINGNPAVEFVLSAPITEPDTYTITIPGGSLKIDGSTLDNELMWSVYLVEDATIEPANSSDLTEALEKVTVSWSGTEITLNPNCKEEVVLSDADGSQNITDLVNVETYEISMGYITDTGYRLAIDFGSEPYATPGKVTITIPAGFVYISQYEQYNEDITITYTQTYDGIENVVVEGGEAVYYDLNGRRVVNPDRGIYIRIQNGKAEKVVK